MRQFIATNQFIEFDMMRRLQIANPQAYLEARYARLFLGINAPYFASPVLGLVWNHEQRKTKEMQAL